MDKIFTELNGWDNDLNQYFELCFVLKRKQKS